MGHYKKYFLNFTLLISSVFIFCEFLIYYVVLMQCSWPDLSPEIEAVEGDSSQEPVRAILLADTHLLGPRKGHWLDKLRREWQMRRAFQTAIALHRPDIVFILGDLFDEGLWCSDVEFAAYIRRFHHLFWLPQGVRLAVVVGNHDIGFHYGITPYLQERFSEAFHAPSLQLLSVRDVHFVLLNSMAMEGDGCFLCRPAEVLLANIAKKLKCSKISNSCPKEFELQKYSRPILLQIATSLRGFAMTPRRHGKKLRSQRLAGTDPQEPLEGNCLQMSHPCGEEAACVQIREHDYQCICPHDNSVPTRDLRCPNRRKVTEKPRPMVVIPPTGSHANVTNSTLPLESESGLLKEGSGVWGLETATLVAGGLLGSLLLLGLMALSICCYSNYTRRARLQIKDNPHTHSHPLSLSTPVSLTKGVIDAQRFAANPEYVGADLYPLTLPTIPREEVTFRHVIGEGCFGKVYKGEVQRQEDGGLLQTVAIKVLKDSASKEAEEDFMREVEIMAGFHHPNILSLIGVALKQAGKSPWMVFEFMPHGDLTEVLRSNGKHFSKPHSNAPKLSQESLLLIATQIACGMKYLAGQHFVHRDLACRNCLVGANLTVKIADFGMSRDVYTCDYYKIGGSRLLPVRWMSPESVTYGRFTLESDVWSYGVVLWEIYTLGKQPYYGHSNEQVVRLILEGKALVPPDDCLPLISGLMKACWAPEPRDRLTFPQIYERLLRGGSPLPRPPPTLVTPTPQVEDYLCPHPRPPHIYLQTLPDSASLDPRLLLPTENLL